MFIALITFFNMAQTVKRLLTMQETRVHSLGQEDPLEKEKATHSSTLAWKIPWTEERGRLQSMGLQRVDFTFTIQAAKTKPGTDCDSGHELLIAKFRLKLKKVGKTISPFRCDLNQIPYDYTVKVTSRFKGLDLIECLKNRRQ